LFAHETQRHSEYCETRNSQEKSHEKAAPLRVGSLIFASNKNRSKHSILENAGMFKTLQASLQHRTNVFIFSNSCLFAHEMWQDLSDW